MVLSGALTVCRYRKIRLHFFVILLFFASCTKHQVQEEETLPFYNTAEFDAEWITETDKSYSKIHTIDTFSLTNQQGNKITKDSLDGYIYVANFFFTACPSICPKMVSNLGSLQKAFANNNQVKLVSFSVMPWIDSVSVLKEYSQAHGIDHTKWHLLTGNKDKIYELGRLSYFAEKGLGLQKKTNEFLHTESMLLIDKKGRIRGIYNATQRADIGRITDDINILLKE